VTAASWPGGAIPKFLFRHHRLRNPGIRCGKLFGPFKLQVDLPRYDPLERTLMRALSAARRSGAGSIANPRSGYPGDQELVVCALDPPFGRYRCIGSIPVRTGEDRLPGPRAPRSAAAVTATARGHSRPAARWLAPRRCRRSPSANRGLTAADTLEFANHAGWNAGDRSRATGPGTTVRLRARRFEVFA
jgi:hypothetical protein